MCCKRKYRAAEWCTRGALLKGGSVPTASKGRRVGHGMGWGGGPLRRAPHGEARRGGVPKRAPQGGGGGHPHFISHWISKNATG